MDRVVRTRWIEVALVGMRDAAVLFIVGAVFVGIPWFFGQGSRPYPNGIMTTGTVVRVDTASSSDTCFADVAYEAGGRTWQVRSGTGSSSLCSLDGATVDVSYPPDRPGGGRVIVSTDQWMLVLFMAIGVLAMGGAVVKVVLTVRDARRWRRAVAPLEPLVPPWADGASIGSGLGPRRRISGRDPARRRGAGNRPGRRDRP
jgi:hypothetical protein